MKRTCPLPTEATLPCSFLVWIPVVSFSSDSSVWGVQHYMEQTLLQCGKPHLGHDLKEKLSIFSATAYNIWGGRSCVTFIVLWCIPFYLIFGGYASWNTVDFFSESFFYSYWDSMIFIFHSVHMVYHIDLFMCFAAFLHSGVGSHSEWFVHSILKQEALTGHYIL